MDIYISDFDKNINVNQISSLRNFNDTTTQVTFYHKPKTRLKLDVGLVNIPFFELIEQIKDTEVTHFQKHKFDIENSPNIYLIRETDKTVYAYFCTECNNISKVYHTFKCHCSRHKKYTGEYLKNKNVLTEQLVILHENDSLGLELKFNSEGFFTTFRNIEIIEKDGEIKGVAKIKGNSILLTPQIGHPIDFNKDNMINNPQHWTWCYEENI